MAGTRELYSPRMIQTKQLVKTYESGAGGFTALDDVSIEIPAGAFAAVIGTSGSGKTTLLNLLAGIDRATSGSIEVAGESIGGLSGSKLSLWRGRTIGLVFQFFQLLPTLTVVENVMLPMELCGVFAPGRRRGEALALLGRAGIADQADKLPAFLSGGQQQRAAIARALANDPPILLADEPTGNLDSQTSDSILALFRSLADGGKTVVMVTHERDIAAYVDRQLVLADGRVAA
jgi:putative ABC transport system ATP-binding protein